jgi:hypothetical protein
MQLKNIWGQVNRPWGYEVRIDIDDAVNIYNETLTFKVPPLQADIDAGVAMLIDRLTTKQAFEVINENGTITQG